MLASQTSWSASFSNGHVQSRLVVAECWRRNALITGAAEEGARSAERAVGHRAEDELQVGNKLEQA